LGKIIIDQMTAKIVESRFGEYRGLEENGELE
jgi:hypothetical protein